DVAEAIQPPAHQHQARTHFAGLTGLGQVDQDARQVEHRGHPGHHEQQVEGLGPDVGLHCLAPLISVGGSRKWRVTPARARGALLQWGIRQGNKLMEKQYDRAYFDKWYRSGGIGGAQRLARKVALAVATAEYWLERPVRSVLDIGCGEGAWRAPLLKLRPKLQYMGFDSSQYAVRRHGARRNLHLARYSD